MITLVRTKQHSSESLFTITFLQYYQAYLPVAQQQNILVVIVNHFLKKLLLFFSKLIIVNYNFVLNAKHMANIWLQP